MPSGPPSSLLVSLPCLPSCLLYFHHPPYPLVVVVFLSCRAHKPITVQRNPFLFGLCRISLHPSLIPFPFHRFSSLLFPFLPFSHCLSVSLCFSFFVSLPLPVSLSLSVCLY